MPLQEQEGQQGVHQHRRHRVEHEGGEVHLLGRGGETSIIDALEGQISGSSNDGATTAQRRSIGDAQIVAQSDLGGVGRSKEYKMVSNFSDLDPSLY